MTKLHPGELQLPSKKTANCAPPTQLTVLVRPRHNFFFFFLQNPDSSHTRVNFGVCWWWGCLHSADLWSRRRCTSSAPKETEDSRIKGGVRQRKQKKEEEQSKSEVWKFVEVLKVLKMDCHSVVGSGNYWVTFVAQSQWHKHFSHVTVMRNIQTSVGRGTG